MDRCDEKHGHCHLWSFCVENQLRYFHPLNNAAELLSVAVSHGEERMPLD